MGVCNQFTGVLTEKQKLACKYYMDKTSDTYGNKTKSYLKAGYKETHNSNSAACMMFSKPKVIEHLGELREQEQVIEGKKSIRDILNADYTLEKAKSHLERCIANGDNTNTTAMLKLLAQVNGLLIDRKEIEQTNHNVANITPQELEALEAIARANNIRLSQKHG